MKAILCTFVAVALLCDAFALPVFDPERMPAGTVEVKGPGFQKTFVIGSDKEEDRYYFPKGRDYYEQRKLMIAEKKKRVADGFDPSIIWQIGEDIWNWIQNNKPVANVSTDWGGAVPENITDWRHLAGWQDGIWTADNNQPWEIKVKGVFGTAAEVKWNWTYKYGGNYQGTGSYLAEAMPVVTDATAKVGEQMYCTTKVFDPLNYGSQEAPVGGLDLEIDCQASGTFIAKTISCHVVMKGDNSHEVLACSLS